MDYESMQFFTGLLEIFQPEIQQNLETYIKNVYNGQNSWEAPLIVNLNINHEKMFQIEGLRVILNTILDEPLQSIKDIRYAAWSYISTLPIKEKSEKRICLQLEQIHCVIRWSGMPLTEIFEFIPFRHPIRLSLSGMKCVLYSYDDRCQFVRQSIWYCPNHCSNNQNHIFDGENLSGRKCSVCYGSLNEHEHRRSIYCCRMIRVINIRSVKAPIQHGKINRQIEVKLSDELCDVEMVLGQTYIIIGTYDILTQMYIAWNFLKSSE